MKLSTHTSRYKVIKTQSSKKDIHPSTGVLLALVGDPWVVAMVPMVFEESPFLWPRPFPSKLAWIPFTMMESTLSLVATLKY